MKTCLKGITNIFPREVQGNFELVSMERRHEWEAHCSLAHLVTSLALHCRSFLCSSGHLFCITNKEMHKQTCCNCVLFSHRQYLWFWTRVQFLVLVLLQHDFVLSLSLSLQKLSFERSLWRLFFPFWS